MHWLLDPRSLNVFVVLVFALLVVRWALAGNWPQVIYWTGAVVLNIGVLMMAKP